MTSIEILVFYPKFIIKEHYNNDKDRIFLFIYIIGAFSGIFSFVYLNICFFKFQKNNQFKIEKLLFLYSEIITILVMHPILIYLYFNIDYPIGSIGEATLFLLGMFIFIFELLLFIINCIYFYNMDDNDSYNIYSKIAITIIKIILYCLIEILLLNLNIPKNYYIFPFLRIIFMILGFVNFIYY